MAKTVNLGLPLISPSQAQKHVTVNEALSRLDTVTQLRVVSSTLAVPPADAGAGASYLVPSNASGEWAGKGGQIAARSNGGWVFLEPVAGWRVWHIGDATSLVYDGKVWIAGAMAVSRSGASTVAEILEFDHTVVVGATSSIANAIPRNTQVIGVTGCVLSTIRGTGVTGWKVGVAGAVSRFGTGLGLAAGYLLHGLLTSPTAHYADTALLLTAEGGNFSGGTVRIAVHLQRMSPPRAS